MSPELDRPPPPYLQIVAHYRELIRSGQLQDGDKIPSARQLVEQWSVAHATAAKVLVTLRTEGLVTTVAGGAGGTVVSVQEHRQTPRAAQGPDRVIVFMDYQNVHGWARRQFLPFGAHPADGHVDPLSLSQLLVQRRRRPSELTEVRVYRGRPSPDHQPRAAAANDRQAAVWQRSGKVTAIRRPLRYPPDWPDSPATEKGIDVAIAIDLVRLAMSKKYDAAVLVSADTDLLPAIETIYDLRLAHIEVATWSGANRLRFPSSQLPWCHYLTKTDYQSVEDPTDYTNP
jgi:DNA-binding transcriptional regulator YhcF (GntR family)